MNIRFDVEIKDEISFINLTPGYFFMLDGIMYQKMMYPLAEHNAIHTRSGRPVEIGGHEIVRQLNIKITY